MKPISLNQLQEIESVLDIALNETETLSELEVDSLLDRLNILFLIAKRHETSISLVSSL